MLDEQPKVVWNPLKLIGQGAFATVHLAAVDMDATTARDVPPLIAVKTIDFSIQTPNSDAASLLRESRLLHLLRDSPFVIRSYGAQVVADPATHDRASLHVLLEYAALGSLEDRLRAHGGALPEDEVRCHTKSILLGLCDIHAHNLVHCDLKPGNLLLVPIISDSSSPITLVTKIADLGLAMSTVEPLDGHFLIGTPLYMAPESSSCFEYAPPCDVWALGCVVLELLTGKLPWDPEGEDDDDDDAATTPLLRRVRLHGCRDLIPTHLSEDAKDFLDKCLVKDPEHRWTPEMLLSHPFVSSQNANQVFVFGEEEEERGLKRGRSPSIIFIDDSDDGEAPDSIDFIPLEGGGKRRKKVFVEEERGLMRSRTPSIVFIDDSEDGEAPDAIDFIPLEGVKRRKKVFVEEERGLIRSRTPSIIFIDDSNDGEALDSVDFIPLEGGKRRTKMSEVKEVVSGLPLAPKSLVQSPKL